MFPALPCLKDLQREDAREMLLAFRDTVPLVSQALSRKHWYPPLALLFHAVTHSQELVRSQRGATGEEVARDGTAAQDQ